MATLDTVFEWIRGERRFQDQRHHTKENSDAVWLAVLVEEVGEVAKAMHEGASRSDLIDELVQVAAVAIAWLEDRG